MMREIYNDDCLERLRLMDENSVDSLVTDPPAGISFMGKAWDGDKGGREQWIAWMTEVMRECLRVLKPGAHGLVWAIPRTSHWTATALENAGFEVRDVVTHLFGSGFPKSLDISKAIDKAAGETRKTEYVPNMKNNDYGKGLGGGQWNAPCEPPKTLSAKQWSGWGTALKPASEHWILVRKPLSEKTVAANVLKHGTGGINIDGCRIEMRAGDQKGEGGPNKGMSGTDFFGTMTTSGNNRDGLGRFPANLVLDEEAAETLDEQSGQLSQCGGPKKTTHDKGMFGIGTPGTIYREENRGASRFFYVAKASKKDKGADNTHPTVKSTKLMEYLITLITPPAGKVLDPFMGSGSTGIAAIRLGFGFVGIERDPEYSKIAASRLEEVLV